MKQSGSQDPGARGAALITGASSGIGLELARLAAADGHDVVLVARRAERLEELAGELKQAHAVRAEVVTADLGSPAAAGEVAGRVAALGLPVEVLVNNAGYGLWGPFVETDLDAELAMVQVNVSSLVALTKQFLPGMVARGRGRVLNVASTAAFQPGPLMAVYYASKAFVLSFSEAVASEVAGTGVSVTALCPGPTASGFQAAAAMESSKLVAGRRMPSSAQVAWAGYRAMQRGKRVAIPGFGNWMLAQSVRLMPRRLVTAVVHRMQEAVAR